MQRSSLIEETSTLVIGAGAAGLAAAGELTQRQHLVSVVEARDRAGGRILTLGPDNEGPAPIELGAEFIHGASPQLMQRLRASGGIAIDAPQTRWISHGRGLVPGDPLLERMKSSLERVGIPRRDVPFAEFLHRHRKSLSPQVRILATMMVQGFDAADVTRASTRDILKEWAGNSAADSPTFRPQGGFGSLMATMVQRLRTRNVGMHFNTRVTEVAWSRGRVTVNAQRFGHPVCLSAERAIIALPLGVLQLSDQSPAAIRFIPVLDDKRSAMNRLGVGPVLKLVLCFREAFWEEIERGRYRDAAFFHAAGASFPTFWSSLPLRAPRLVAWTAGPNAARLADKTPGELLDEALASLAELFGPRIPYRRLLQAHYQHDWQKDPFACGAYSYVLAGGASARKLLAAPMQNTLFFAGEASDTEGEPASVAGALASGTRAAQQLLGSLR